MPRAASAAVVPGSVQTAKEPPPPRVTDDTVREEDVAITTTTRLPIVVGAAKFTVATPDVGTSNGAAAAVTSDCTKATSACARAGARIRMARRRAARRAGAVTRRLPGGDTGS